MQLGVLSYEANELAKARYLLETGVELCRALSLHCDAQGEERLALTLDALGEHDAALEARRRHVDYRLVARPGRTARDAQPNQGSGDYLDLGEADQKRYGAKRAVIIHLSRAETQSCKG